MPESVLRQAQESGQIDVYWEYTGTSLITFNKVADKLDAEATYAKVKELDAALGTRDPVRDPLGSELDSMRRATERQSREAQAEELLRALKQRMSGGGPG